MYNLWDQSSLWFRPDGVWVAKVVWMISILEKDNVLLDVLAICFVFTEVDWTVTGAVQRPTKSLYSREKTPVKLFSKDFLLLSFFF